MDENKMRAMIGALKLDVLESLLHEEPRGNEADAVSEWFDTLCKQAIVIECEVEHDNTFRNYKHEDRTIVWTTAGGEYQSLKLRGHHSTPGKAIALILSLEEKDE